MRTKLLIALITIAVLAIMIGLPGYASQVKAEPAASTSTPSGVPTATYTEIWKTGFTVEGSTAYSSITGRLLSETASFRSDKSTDIFFMFPAPATTKTITAAKYYLLARTGTYPGTATLRLDVFNFAGTLMRTVTAAPVDLNLAPLGAWTNFSLIALANDLLVNSGEYLCAHFSLDGAPSGTLDLRPIFEITLR